MLRILGPCVGFLSAEHRRRNNYFYICVTHQRETPHRFTVRRVILLFDDVVFRAIREFCDVFATLFVDDQDVVFTITAGTW